MIPDVIWQLLQMWGGWGGRDKKDVCFLDDWKRVVQFTELGGQKEEELVY